MGRVFDGTDAFGGQDDCGIKERTMSRTSGKHNPDNVLLGIHTTPEIKALAGLVADLLGSNITDTLLDGLYSMAERVGVMRGVKVLPQFKDEITLRAAQVRAAKKERQTK